MGVSGRALLSRQKIGETEHFLSSMFSPIYFICKVFAQETGSIFNERFHLGLDAFENSCSGFDYCVGG